MKKLNFKLILVLLAAIPVMMLSSCTEDDGGDDDVKTNEFLPVLNENFEFTIEGNNVKFTTKMNGNVFVTVNDEDYPFVDKAVTVFIAQKGTYSFTCSSFGSGSKLTSDAFSIEILQDDKSFLELPEWKNLTDGTSKSWVLDVDAKLHDGPISFYTLTWDFVAGAYTDDATWFWTPDPAWAWANALAEPGTDGYGVMTFDVTDGFKFTADKKKEDPESGTFAFDYEKRTLKLTGASILRSYKPNADVKTDPTCVDTDAVKCETRKENGITGISDWSNYHIFALTDSVLRVAVLRDQDVTGEGDIYIVYNFVEKVVYESIIPETFTYTEPVNTSFTANDLVGTWKFPLVPYDWVGWYGTGNKGSIIEAAPLNNWADSTAMIGTGWAISSADLKAALDDVFVFNNDGTCNLNGVANTYTVANGVITFGSEATISVGWFAQTGTSIKVLNVVGASIEGGIWIGNKNGDKSESSSFHLIKQ
jgi:hypothetical protein